MKPLKIPLSWLCSLLLLVGSTAPVSAQTAVRIDPAKGGMGWFTRPYQQRSVPQINLTNSDRLQSLVRAGNLYLSAQDVIALALENNLDIEIQRYGPLLNKEVTKRTQGGGATRTVGVPVTAGPQSVSLTGVSLTASGGTGTAGGVTSGAGITTSLGPAIPNLDPQLFFYGNWGHSTQIFSNLLLTGTPALININSTFQAQYSQSFDFGMNAQLTFTSNRNKLNSTSYDLDPYTSGNIDLQVSQNLLQGFGRPVLTRNIRVSKNNEKISDLTFKQQVITTVSAVLNLYWDLVSFIEDVKARKDELATAQALFDDNKKQVEIGTLAPIEVTRAEAQVYSSQQDLLVSQTNVLQQETVLKNALSRNGVANPLLADVHIVPLDTIKVPEKDEIQPIDDLVKEAVSRRVEVAQNNINVDSQKILLRGIKNELKPTLQAFAELTNNGLAGQPNYLAPDQATPIPALTGGYGSLLGQIFRRNYPSYSAGLSLSIPLRNRTAQSDYITTALSLRQSELQLQKELNQVRVDVQNAVIGLRQARVRYESAVKARILQQQTLDADKKKYSLGATTVFQVVTDQQTLAAAQSSEQQAIANYSHARISFDQAIGTTLDVNTISIDEAIKGQVARPSLLPANLPEPGQRQ